MIHGRTTTSLLALLFCGVGCGSSATGTASFPDPDSGAFRTGADAMALPGTYGGSGEGGIGVGHYKNACPNGESTTVTGKVFDPAGKNPLYNIQVFVPAGPLPELPKGVPASLAQACSCGSLYPASAYASTATAVDGTFTLSNVPMGTQKLVLQIGKWRRVLTVDVKNECGANTLGSQVLTLPGTVAAGSEDSMPDIAVSTGVADSLECLLLRIGIPASEYVAGASTAGHVHVFSGGEDTTTLGMGPYQVGIQEFNPMPGAPTSSKSLWADPSQLMPFDIVLLSCEGGETYNANPQALENYLNAGGRAFASHYHYGWFSGPINTQGVQAYAPPADWGNNLGQWTGENGALGSDNGDIGGVIDQTLNPGPGSFAKGATLASWLGEVGALGQGGAPAGELSIYQPRFNVTVGPSNIHSQPWITADPQSGNGGATMYFSFDTPLNAAPTPDGGSPNYCGRAVFSDLHVGSDPSVNDTVNGIGGFEAQQGGGDPPPAGCGNTDLSPQEKALEFMLFDLSSCVTDDAKPVPDAGQVYIPPPK